MKDICNDVDIRDGMIRQRTNDSATAFEIDLSPILNDLSLPIINLKTKLELFKIFSDQEVEISVHDPDETHSQGYFVISDNYSSLEFDGPELDFMDNKFISEEELNNIFVLNEEDLILNVQTEITSTISDRMRVISQGFNVNTVQVIFEGETASISTRTQSKDQFAKIVSGVTTDRVLNCSSSLINTPFIIDHDGDIIFKMYNYPDNICSNQFITTVGDVDVNVYSRSSLVEEGED